VSGATSYKVYFEIGSSTTKNLAGTVSGTSYTHTGLTAGTNYYYYIKAVNSAGESGYSSSASAAPSGGGGTTTVPSAPTGVSASALSSSSIQITWNAPSSGTPTYYNVYRSSSSSGTYSFRAIVSGSVKTYTDTGLSSSTTYYYRITAENNSGESAMSITFGYATTQSGGGGTTTKPGTPTGVTATALSSDSIRITWSAVSGATKYNIYYGSSSTSAFTSLDGTSTTTSFTSTGNPAGSTSYFKVSAVNSAGESAKSSTVSATTTSSGGGGGSSSYGSLTIVNSSSHAIRNFTIYQSGYNLIGGTGFYLLSGTINAGSSQTFTNVPAGSYVRIGSETYGGYKVSRDTTWTVTSGQTTTLTVQSTWVVAN
jgi:fibronectin type 3 domain-containing protein